MDDKEKECEELTEKTDSKTGTFRKGAKVVFDWGKDIVGLIVGICFWAMVIPHIKDWYNQKQATSKFYHEVYNLAEKSIKQDLSDVYNVEVEEYDRDNIKYHGCEKHNFGEGELTYYTYLVSVDVEYDAPLGHMQLSPNIVVYYYDKNRDTSNEAGANIASHFYVRGMDSDLQDLMDLPDQNEEDIYSDY